MNIAEEDALLEAGRIALDNVGSHPLIVDLLAARGCDGAELERGRSLLDAARGSRLTQKEEREDLIEARAALKEVGSQTLQDFIDDLELTRLAHKEPSERWLTLGLTGRRPRTLSALLIRAPEFYQKLLSDQDAQQAVASKGLTREVLERRQGQLRVVEQRQAAVYIEAAESKEATRLGDTAFEAFADWWDEFVTIARIALRAHPDLLARLGL
jgi:hypothetical protein